MLYPHMDEHESAEELHQAALSTDAYFATQIAKHRGTSAETLHYLLRKEIFSIPVMARRGQDEGPLEDYQKIELWESAVSNPALRTEDLIWVYEQVTGSTYDPKVKVTPNHNFTWEEVIVLRGIGVHYNTPSALMETIKEIQVKGKPVLQQYDFDLHAVNEYTNYMMDKISGRPVAPTPPPKPKTIPKPLPTRVHRSRYFHKP